MPRRRRRRYRIASLRSSRRSRARAASASPPVASVRSPHRPRRRDTQRASRARSAEAEPYLLTDFDAESGAILVGHSHRGVPDRGHAHADRTKLRTRPRRLDADDRPLALAALVTRTNLEL